MVAIESRAEEREVRRWWRDLQPSPQVELDHHWALEAARDIPTPNDDWYAPSRELVALADAICDILRRLLGDSWKVVYKTDSGLRDMFDARPAALFIELRAGKSDGDDSNESPELIARFACPEPVARPVPSEPTARPNTGAIAPDVAWTLASVEAMPARQRAAVAGFIHGLREGASLFSEVDLPRP